MDCEKVTKIFTLGKRESCGNREIGPQVVDENGTGKIWPQFMYGFSDKGFASDKSIMEEHT